jgi:hypothetical protein
VTDLVLHMGVNEESPIYNAPTNNQWHKNAALVMGADWRFESTPDWWDANTDIARTANWTTFLPWFVLWDGKNHGDNLNCRVQLKDMEFWGCDMDWKWTRLQGPAQVSGNGYRRDLQGESSDGRDQRTESDGTLSVRFNHSSPNVYHGWSSKINNIDSRNYRAFHARLKGRKILHNTAGTDDRDKAVYLVHVGGDPHPNSVAHVNPNNPDSNYMGITWLPGIGCSRFGFVGNDWTIFTFTTLNVAHLDGAARGTRENWIITTQELFDHPPPLNY